MNKGYHTVRKPVGTDWMLVLATVVLVMVTVGNVTTTRAAIVTDFPLQPPDTSSPRATMDSFLSNMLATHQEWEKTSKLYKEEGGWYPSQAVQDQRERAGVFFRRARRCLDLSQVPSTLLERVGVESTVLLKTIFDRISIPDLESIPDADEMNVDERVRWRLPNTDIEIVKVLEGPRSGEFLFSPATVDRLGEDYERIKHFPHKPGGWVGVYTLYTDMSGGLIPGKLIYLSPSWVKTRYFNHPFWKWLVLAFLLALAVVALALVFRLRSGHPHDPPLRRNLRRILFPVSLALIAFLLDYLQGDIGFRGNISEGMTTSLLAVTFLASGWTILLMGAIFAESVIASPRITTTGLDAAMIRVVSRIVCFGFAAWVVIVGAQTIGIPLVPVLAGLGVGGLALALSAQPTVENFIGGMTLFVDRPVRLGEMCKFGDKFGVVEEIGVRSTRLRTLDRTLITVPNAEFSKLQLENYSHRDKIWFHPRIRLRSDTTPDQLRYILIEIRKLLYAHPKVLRDPARIRFVDFGTYSLDLDIFAYIDVTDYGEYLGIAEDLNLRIMELISKSGSALAIPASRMYTQESKGPDEQRVREVEAEVQNWRETQSLYLPDFPEKRVDDLADSLEYPPPGSPIKRSEGEG